MTTTVAEAPQKTTVGAKVISNTKGDNLVQFDVTYYIKFNVYLGGMILSAGNSLPYIWVCSDSPNSGTWTVAKTGTTNGGVTLPVSNTGQYRLYIREPQTSDKVGGKFTIPFHASRYVSLPARAVQPLYAIDVTDAADGLEIKPLFPIEYPSRPTTGATQKVYPKLGAKKALNNKHTLKAPLNMGDYKITYQLWADASQAYGILNSYIAKAKYSDALKILYNGIFLPEVVNKQETKNGCVLLFKDGNIERKLIFQDNSTQNARGYKSFASDKTMAAEEAIRRTHPSVFDYWLKVMSDFNMVSATVSSAWRPAIGSIYHRYSLGLDINKFTAKVLNPTTKKTEEVNVSLTRETGNNGATWSPVKVSELTSKTSMAKTLTTKLYVYLAQDRISSTREIKIEALEMNFSFLGMPKLGWLGAPWAMTYTDLGINYKSAKPAIATNYDHRHHLHLTIKDDLE
ncbi:MULTISPECIES: hypothetical protein [Entomomonas]|uniref:Uncharacterized protein n=1 Tax=Entomomonas asaccharolytica TaxID=2785331 RepID=A0A974NHY6_9GAMM|nr:MULTISPECIES: hypothetical protein [Entomomonas]QQP86888.1 hypothetical protein JHT90_06495 [Entomomonas asaccharolytica]UYZ83493.1 hypothetical protein MTZ49_12955 [Entomomonas sp. E2T0]